MSHLTKIIQEVRKSIGEPVIEQAKLPKLGSGKRFAALKAKIGRNPGARNPGAIAAAEGRKKYGAKKMAQMAAAGRRRK